MTTPSLAATPITEIRTVPLRRPNSALRTREHLTLAEVEELIEAAKGNRWGCRDALMILLAFRHGLRAGEVVDLRWEQVDCKRDLNPIDLRASDGCDDISFCG